MAATHPHMSTKRLTASSTDLRYDSEVLVVNLSISICCNFMLFTPLHLFDDINYQLLFRFNAALEPKWYIF